MLAYRLTLLPDRTIHYKGKLISGKASQFFVVDTNTYVITYQSGVYKFNCKGYESIPSPISPVFSHPRQIEGGDFNLNPTLLITRNKLVRVNQGSGEYSYETLSGVRKGSRLSSVCRYQNKVYLGTTFNGVYVKPNVNSNIEWVKIYAGLPREKYSWGEYFYDDVKNLFVYRNSLFAFCKHTGELLELNVNQNYWEKTSISNAKSVWAGNEEVYVNIEPIGWGKLTYNETNYSVVPISHSHKYSLVHQQDSWEITKGKLIKPGRFNNHYPYKDINKYTNIRQDIRSLFINLDFITYEEMDVVTNLLEKGVVNALVINFKDDTGNLLYGTKLPMAKMVGSDRKHYKWNDFYRRIKSLTPYIIARVVTFKDFRLYRYNSNEYALRDKRTGEPWRVNGHEYWVDPFSQEVQNYNLSICKELEERADEFLLDEIQFDYIRFPSDKEIRHVNFRYRKKKWERYDILESFLSKVTNTLNVPFSLDIYGYNGIYRMGNVIGQDIETISKYAPIICPMHYPSHFGSVYISSRPGSREYNLLKFALEQATEIVYEGTIIRPYLQAFTYRTKNFGQQYLMDQIQGSADGGAKGVGFWHPTSKYSLVKKYLEAIFK